MDTPVIKHTENKLSPCFIKTHSCLFSCEWVENDEDGITTPYQCRYKTDGDWSVSLDTGTDSQSIYSLSRNSRDLIVDITCRTANELRVKVKPSHFCHGSTVVLELRTTTLVPRLEDMHNH